MSNHQTANIKNCAILISAYKAEKWIIDCIDGFLKQAPLEGWNYNIVIGIDGCEDTAKVLDDNKISYYWSKENVGVYIMVNSLIEKTIQNTDIFVHFGADDVPMPEYLKTVIPVVEKIGFTKVKEWRCDKNLNPKPKKEGSLSGTLIFRKDILDKVGGFHHFRAACDTDFTLRVKRCGLGSKSKKEKEALKEPLFYRRRHSKSLTKNPDTKMRSAYRNKCKELMNQWYSEGKIKIEPITTELEYIKNDK